MIDPLSIFAIGLPLIGFLGMATIVISIIRQVKRARQLSVLPEGMSFRAAGTLLNLTLSYPFVKITIEKNCILINFAGQKLNLWKKIDYKPQITEGLFFEGLRLSINTNNDTVIWTPYAQQLKALLAQDIKDED